MHAATTNQYRLQYHQVVGIGGPTQEFVSMTDSCFYTPQGSFSENTAPVLLNDPASSKPAIACGRGNTMIGFRWSAGAWAGESVMSSTSLLSAVANFSQVNGVGAYMWHAPSGGGTWRHDLTMVHVDPANVNGAFPLTVVTGESSTVSALSVLSARPGSERLAYFATPPNQPADAGVVRVQTADAGVFAWNTLPWVNVSEFAQDRDGTIVGVDRQLRLWRFSNGTWTSSVIQTPSGNMTDVHLIADAAGVLRVAWSTTSGVWLASLFGGQWYVERLTTRTDVWSVRVAANASGKTAVIATYSLGLSIFE